MSPVMSSVLPAVHVVIRAFLFVNIAGAEGHAVGGGVEGVGAQPQRLAISPWHGAARTANSQQLRRSDIWLVVDCVRDKSVRNYRQAEAKGCLGCSGMAAFVGAVLGT